MGKEDGGVNGYFGISGFILGFLTELWALAEWGWGIYV